MALQQTIALSNGQTGNYIRVGSYLWDPITRQASANLLLYTSAAFRESAPSDPVCLIAKLRLVGDKFDEYLANSVLNGLTDTVVAQLYAAAKAEALIPGGGLTSLDLSGAVEV